ncbi:MAG: bifunctional ornithine acetyltransferase/N-acetylglutamate synthase, partial [Methanobacterium sp.]|nr:bifunctional ornithine acetyltransferase/N-acetylglutamate synthase [Methanobacterium sp.]
NDGKKVRIGGICKGSGMIAPNMGTMLCFITTDIKATPQELESSLKKAVDESFNMVVVDGDESTNDTVIIMANRKSGKIDENFQEALNFLCIKLARLLARDGEGATKLIEVAIKGAYNKEDARKAARSVVKSPLVKTAVFGSDPNWGRIVAAVGYSGAQMDPDKISVILSSDNEEVNIVNQGKVKAFENTEELHIAEKIMQKEEIKIMVDLGLGNDSATAFGCDLSYDYVKINAEYTT